jgi:hypothetical protein
MNKLLLLPLALTVVSCGSERARPTVPSVPQRDLTIQSPTAPTFEIASPVELGRRPEPKARKAAAPQQTIRREPKIVLTTVHPAATLSLTVPAPVVQTAPADEPATDRELPPGKTVTIIPASSGPTVAVEPAGDGPGLGRTEVRRDGGGKCHGRGGRTPGISIAAAPRPRFR